MWAKNFWVKVGAITATESQVSTPAGGFETRPYKYCAPRRRESPVEEGSTQTVVAFDLVADRRFCRVTGRTEAL